MKQSEIPLPSQLKLSATLWQQATWIPHPIQMLFVQITISMHCNNNTVTKEEMRNEKTESQQTKRRREILIKIFSIVVPPTPTHAYVSFFPSFDINSLKRKGEKKKKKKSEGGQKWYNIRDEQKQRLKRKQEKGRIFVTNQMT